MARVLLLDQYAGLGGGQRILVDLTRAFRAAGHGVRVMVPGRGTVEDLLRREGIGVLDLPLPAMTPGRKPLREKLAYPVRARRAAAEVEALLRRDPADLIYANAPRCVLPAVLAARRLRVPVVCGLHLIFKGGLEQRLLRWCFGRPEVKRVILCSAAVAAPFSDVCSAKGRKIHYWVSPEFLEVSADRAGARSALGLSEREVAVGVLGRISRTKGQRLFLEALLPLLSSCPDLKLFVAGAADFEDPREEGELRAMAEASSDPSRVVVTGRMVESRPFLDALDVLVVPSLWDEPFGLVAVEGMARSLPVVVTRSGGLVEIVEDGVTGFHADKEPGQLREAVLRLAQDRDLRFSMGQAGRRRVEDRFHPARQMGKILQACFE
jgi:glycosyltransferase involved in cell wall biosynthesis